VFAKEVASTPSKTIGTAKPTNAAGGATSSVPVNTTICRKYVMKKQKQAAINAA
jgi:hypothetical protein